MTIASPEPQGCKYCGDTWRELRRLLGKAERRRDKGLPVDTAELEAAQAKTRDCAHCTPVPS